MDAECGRACSCRIVPPRTTPSRWYTFPGRRCGTRRFLRLGWCGICLVPPQPRTSCGLPLVARRARALQAPGRIRRPPARNHARSNVAAWLLPTLGLLEHPRPGRLTLLLAALGVGFLADVGARSALFLRCGLADRRRFCRSAVANVGATAAVMLALGVHSGPADRLSPRLRPPPLQPLHPRSRSSGSSHRSCWVCASARSPTSSQPRLFRARLWAPSGSETDRYRCRGRLGKEWSDLLAVGADDPPTGLGHLVPDAGDVAERLGDDQPRVVGDLLE